MPPWHFALAPAGGRGKLARAMPKPESKPPRPSLLAWLTTPYWPSGRRVAFVAAFVTLIAILAGLGLLP